MCSLSKQEDQEFGRPAPGIHLALFFATCRLHPPDGLRVRVFTSRHSKGPRQRGFTSPSVSSFGERKHLPEGPLPQDPPLSCLINQTWVTTPHLKQPLAAGRGCPVFLETRLDPPLELEVGMASLEAQGHLIRGLEASTDTGSVSKKKEGTGYLPAMLAIKSSFV